MGKHREWRKIAKKMRRKRIRTMKAVERDEKLKEEEERRALSPSYVIWVQEQELLEKFQQEEEERIHHEQNERWLEEERLAKERWKQQQKKLERIKAEKAKQELIIREEWEREQKKLKEEALLRQQELERKQREQAVLSERIEKYVSGESERLPSSAVTTTETQPGAPECPFFGKVAACRFKDDCSRNHIRPSVSKTLLFPGFYSHFRIEHVNQFNEYDTDVGLEFEDKEIYQHFLEFHRDVLTELKTYGTVVQFKVCRNEEPHLRGNVYVQYSSERYAIRAFRALQGRYYGGKRISVEFCNIKLWSKAICGLFTKKKCPKGSRCNFLHVFRNPGNEFYKSDRDIFDDKTPSRSVREKPEEWRWSASPEPICYSDSEPKKSDRSEIVSNHKRSKRDYHSKHTKHSRSRSRSKDLRETEYENDVFSKKKSSRRRKRSRSNSSRRKRHSDRERDETRYS